MGINKIIVSDFFKSPALNEHGEVIFRMIKESFDNGDKVIVSFKDIHALNSSFVNSAFIELLEYYSFDKIKRNLDFTNSTKKINEMLLKRFNDEVQKRKHLVEV